MDATGVGAVANLATSVIGRLWPDKSEQERAQMAAALTIVQGQLDANRVEAASPSAFTSGWRPAIGWVCGAALGMQYIARPLVAWVGIVTGHPLPELPGIDENLWELMLGLLGLGGLRTFEKTRGVAR
jgi:hypothetical protein